MTRNRTLAAIVALSAWAGLILRFIATMEITGSLGQTLWTLSRFFTIATNLLIAIVLTAIAFGRNRWEKPRLLGGITLFILLVGIVYGLLLRGLTVLSGYAIPADMLLHQVTPVLVPLYWLLAVRKGQIRGHDPLLWMIYPFAYLGYALARGMSGDKYAYPFIDPAKHGWAGVGINVAVISAGFLIFGYALLWLDRRMRSSFTTGLPL